MKSTVIVVFLLSIHLVTATLGNPFASKKSESGNTIQERMVTEPVYRGYLSVNNLRIAIIEYGGEQQAVKVGDKIEKRIITKIEKDYLIYRIDGKEYKMLITDQP